MKGKIKISLAAKFAVTFAVLFLSVMVIVAFAVRQIIISQLTSQYQRDLASSLHAIQLLEDLNRRIFIIMGAGTIIAIVLSIWRIRAVAKPLHRLADTASKLSWDKLNVKFDGGGNDNDEVGVLNDALRKMVRRLRQSRIELAVAEQKAAFADIAGQVNHDLKNGFIPIRNVMQHWMEVAETDAGKLIQIFNERKATVLESLDYLENLVQNYAQLRLNTRLSEVNVNQIIFDLLASYQDISDERIQFQAHFDPSEPSVQADAMQLRRAFENVLRNAIEAISGHGMISVSTAVQDNQVIITWRDSGAGIPEEVSRQMFKAHVTTKPGGSGLGLINVKRIIEDFGGTVTVASKTGQGTTIRFTLPAISSLIQPNPGLLRALAGQAQKKILKVFPPRIEEAHR